MLVPSVTWNHRIILVCHLCPALKLMRNHLSALMGPVIGFKVLERAPLVCHLTLHPHIRKKVRFLVGVPFDMAKGDGRMGEEHVMESVQATSYPPASGKLSDELAIH